MAWMFLMAFSFVEGCWYLRQSMACMLFIAFSFAEVWRYLRQSSIFC